jgi:hypothetical protein
VTPLPPEAARLHALPPSRFVAERDALARALSEKGDTAAAAAVRALRRPVGLAWVMNRLAQAEPGGVAALLDAADRVRRGQRRALAGEGADDLRAAEVDLRGRARALRDAAAPLLGDGAAPQALSRLELLFRLAAASPAAREALRAGRLAREPEAEPMDLSGLAVVDGGAAPRRAEALGAGTRGGAERRDGAGRAKERARARRAEGATAERSLREQHARAAAAARARDAALKRARSALARAEAKARRAEVAASRAEAAATRATERARALRRQADAARADAAARAREVEGARAGRPEAPPPPP